MKHTAVILVIILAVISVPAVTSDVSEAYSEETAHDGTKYHYETYGNDQSTYRSTVFKIEAETPGLYISTVLEGHDVTEIASGALSDRTTRFIVIPENVKMINTGAFTGCAALGSVYFLGDAPDIASGAFSPGVKYHSVGGSSGWERYPSAAVEECTLISEDGSSVTYYIIEGEGMAAGGTPSVSGSVTIRAEANGYPVTSVGPYSFSGKKNADNTDIIPRTDITSAVIEDGVRTVRERAFYYNTGMTSVIFPDSLEAVADEAFRAAGSMDSPEMFQNIWYIGFEAFRQCRSFDTIEIPDSVTFIGEGAFKICAEAQRITIGKGLSKILPWTFAYCSMATSVQMKGDIRTVGDSAFYMCGSLASVSLPDCVESIGSEAFYSCASLERVSLGKTLISIGRNAFSECSVLNGVHVPGTVSQVHSKAFAYCPGMTDIYFAGSMPAFGDSVFLNNGSVVHCSEKHKDSWAGFDGALIIDRDGGWMVRLAVALLCILACGTASLVHRKIKSGR